MDKTSEQSAVLIKGALIFNGKSTELRESMSVLVEGIRWKTWAR